MPPGKVHEGSNLETYLITEMKMYCNMSLTKANANYNLENNNEGNTEIWALSPVTCLTADHMRSAWERILALLLTCLHASMGHEMQWAMAHALRASLLFCGELQWALGSWFRPGKAPGVAGLWGHESAYRRPLSGHLSLFLHLSAS